MPKRDKNRQTLFSKATLSAAMAENPSVMTAAGWRSDENGDIVQDMQDDPGVSRLANNLSEISLMPLYDLGIGFAGEALLSIPKVRNAVASYRLAKEIGKGAKSFSKASKRSAGKLVPYSDGLRESAPISKELPVSSSDASITRAKSYSGYTPTDQTMARSFVDDIKEALDWESKRGKALPSTNEYISLNPRDYIGYGREAYVYSNPENPEEVLKVLHGEAVPGVGIRRVPNFETPEEAIGFAERYVSGKNMRPYNLVENIVGVTDSGANGYAPVLSQRKVVPANKAYNKTWEEIDSDITKLGERIGDRHYTSNIRARADRKYIPEAGRRPTNNIIYENDFQKAMVDPDTGKVYFETKDLRKDNVGYLKDGSLIGFDLFKNGGFVDNEYYPVFKDYRRGGRKETFLKDSSDYSGGGTSGGRAADPRDIAAASANKYERIGNGRYWSAYDSLVNGGATPEDSDRLARILAAQSALETGWVDRNDTNNYAGYRYNGKNMSFGSPVEFWDYHIKNLDEKWPGWRDADSVQAYYNIVNHPDLGLTTREKFDAYNRSHRDNPVYIYAPDWENENYLGKLKSVYDRYINKYVPALGNALSGGGKIHIKKSKKGTFTAAAKKHGKSVQAFASQVLANKGNYSPAMVKKANFARNAAKWHSDGGAINKAFDNGDIDVIKAAINNVLARKMSGK